MMWHRTINYSSLLSSKRWKVELHEIIQIHPSLKNNKTCKLKNLIKERKLFALPNESETSEYIYIGLENVTSNTGELVGNIQKRNNEIQSRSKIFFSGDILFGRLRPALNKAIYIEPNSHSGFCSPEFIVFEVIGDQITPRVLRYILASDLCYPLIKNKATGLALPRLSPKELWNLDIPLIAHDKLVALDQELERIDHFRIQLRSLVEKLHPAMLEDLTKCIGKKQELLYRHDCLKHLSNIMSIIT